MKNKTLLIGGGLVVVILLVFLFLRGGYKAPATQQTPAPGSTEVEEKVVAPEGEESTEEVREVAVEGDEYSFSPASISVNEGERIKLTFKNVGGVPHNITIEGLGVATRTISGGQSDTIEFTAEKGGTLSIYCSVGNHRALGMEGELKVE